jgi:hypothetical protein
MGDEGFGGVGAAYLWPVGRESWVGGVSSEWRVVSREW